MLSKSFSINAIFIPAVTEIDVEKNYFFFCFFLVSSSNDCETMFLALELPERNVCVVDLGEELPVVSKKLGEKRRRTKSNGLGTAIQVRSWKLESRLSSRRACLTRTDYFHRRPAQRRAFWRAFAGSRLARRRSFLKAFRRSCLPVERSAK